MLTLNTNSNSSIASPLSVQEPNHISINLAFLGSGVNLINHWKFVFYI